MNQTIIALAISYVVIAILLLSLNLASRWRWWIKAGAIVVTSAFFFHTYIQARALLGWPSPDRLPAKFQMHWASVVDPDKGRATPGAIFMWVEELDPNNVPNGIPRAFRLPWSKELAEKIEAAKAQIEQGTEVAGTAEAMEEQEADATESDRSNSGNQANVEDGIPADATSFMGTPQNIEFQEMPQVVLPDKPRI